MPKRFRRVKKAGGRDVDVPPFLWGGIFEPPTQHTLEQCRNHSHLPHLGMPYQQYLYKGSSVVLIREAANSCVLLSSSSRYPPISPFRTLYESGSFTS